MFFGFLDHCLELGADGFVRFFGIRKCVGVTCGELLALRAISLAPCVSAGTFNTFYLKNKSQVNLGSEIRASKRDSWLLKSGLKTISAEQNHVGRHVFLCSANWMVWKQLAVVVVGFCASISSWKLTIIHKMTGTGMCSINSRLLFVVICRRKDHQI